MPTDRFLYSSFTGGEVTPEFWGRLNDDKYMTGVAKMQNFIALPHGPARTRPGLEYVAKVKGSSKKVRLIPFSYSTSQTMVIELGAGYFRFHTNGSTLVNANGTPYEVANDYAEDDLADITYVQSADVLTLCHKKYPPKELRRYGALDWRFVNISFSAPIKPPTGLGISAYYGSSTASYTYTYCVTAVNADDEESQASASISVAGNLYATGGNNTVTWQAVSGAVKYKVYKKYSGVMGYIGVTRDTSFKDDLITPNAAKVPPEYDIDLSVAGEYPSCVTYYEQRRCFAGSANSPQTLWMTETGTENSMRQGIVTQDTDAIEVRVATREANTIRHLIPLSSLVLMTSSTELVCNANSGAITQTNISIKPQAYIGASAVQPVIVNNVVLYVAARGNHIRELGYQWQANGVVTADVSLRAPHLFDGQVVKDMAFSRSPYPICWCVSSDGSLLGMTYIPEESIGGWHRHITDGEFESCCVVTENNDDRLYVIVKRTINGKTVKYIERMQDMLITDDDLAFFVDSGLSADFGEAAYTTVSGLDHLEGKTVSILADGAVHPQQVVKDGKITLDHAASKVVVGLPYRALLKTLPVYMQIDPGMGTGRPKNVLNCWVRVYEASGIFAGYDENHLYEYKQRKNEPLGRPADFVDDEINIRPSTQWNRNGQIVIVQDDPLPLTIVSVTLQLSVGG